MKPIKLKSYSAKAVDITQERYIIEADGEILGRVAVVAANLLIGKHKPTYTAHIDGGDSVVITNAAKISVTGQKLTQKIYYNYSGYPSGLKQKSLSALLSDSPEKVLRLAVKGMLPKNKLLKDRLRKLTIYAGSLPETAKSDKLISVKVGKNE